MDQESSTGNRRRTGNPRVLGIVVTWNRKERVLYLLECLRTLDFSAGTLDILLVDNDSTDGTADAVASLYPEIHRIRNPVNRGGSGGFNAGLQWAFSRTGAPYDYLWLLDDDIVPRVDCLDPLVRLLEETPDAAIAGSTMMQLETPWRINEMGSFVEPRSARLILNRHLEGVTAWNGRTVEDLRSSSLALSHHLENCPERLDVEYVAAASLLVRTDIAEQAGPWMDAFLHYDDVEWCTRVARMGYRVLVSSRSVIWHLSGVSKIQSWHHYYDSRNILHLVWRHFPESLADAVRSLLRRALYLALVGKTEGTRFIFMGIDDFRAGGLGQKQLTSKVTYDGVAALEAIVSDQSVKRILVAWPLAADPIDLREPLVRWRLKDPRRCIDCLVRPKSNLSLRIPGARYLGLPANRLRRWIRIWKLGGRYDLFLQSDYFPLICLPWPARQILYAHKEGVYLKPVPGYWELGTLIFKTVTHWLWRRTPSASTPAAISAAKASSASAEGVLS